MTQFSRKSADALKDLSDFISCSATPRKLVLITVEPSSFSLPCFCIRVDVQSAGGEDHILDRDQQIIRDMNGDRFYRVYWK